MAAAAAPAAPAAAVETRPDAWDEKEDYDKGKFVVAVCNDKTTKFLVSRRGLKRFSQLFRDMTDIAEDEPLPLDDEGAEKDIVASFVLWINHHDADPSEKFTRIAYPLQTGELKDIYADWDLRFMETYIVPAGEMKLPHIQWLYYFGRLGVFLNAQVCLELSSGYMAWKIRKLEEDGRKDGAPSAESQLRAWFGLTGEFTEDERQKILKDHEQFKDPGDILVNLKENSEKAHDEADKDVWSQAAASS